MPWKLIAFLTILFAITCFIGFNLDNRCDVSFVFYKYENVPIFVSVLGAYLAGAISVFPFFIVHRSRAARKGKGSGTVPAGTRVGDGLGATASPSKGRKRKGSGKGNLEWTAERARSGLSDEYDID